MKKLAFLIIMIFCLPLVIAADTGLYWEKYQKDDSQSARWASVASGGTASGGYSDRDWNISIISAGLGSPSEPVAANLDSDDEIEIIVTESTVLRALTVSGTSVNIDAVVTIPESITGHIQIIDVDDDGVNDIIFAGAQTIYAYEKANSTFTHKWNATNSTNLRTGVSCVDRSGIDLCYVGDSVGYMYEINAETGSFSVFNFTALKDLYTDSLTRYFNPTIYDIDGDGQLEVSVLCDDNLNNKFGFCVYDVTSGNPDTGFSSDGVVDDVIASTSIGTPRVSGFNVVNIDNSGTPELCATSKQIEGAGTQTCELACVDSLGNLFSRVLYHSALSVTDVYCSPPSTIDIDNAGGLEVCAAYDFDYSASSNWEGGISCMSGSTGSLQVLTNLDTIVGGNVVVNSYVDLTILDVDDDGYEDVFTGNIVYFNDGDSTFTESRTDFSNTLKTGGSSAADINNDGFLDMMVSDSSPTETYILLGTDTNDPPTLNNSLLYGGYTGFYLGAPTCNGTAITFSAQQEGEDSNYDNDVSTDKEFISTNCGQNNAGLDGNLTDGTSSLTNPTFSCFYDSPGLYIVRLYLRDESNPSDLTQFNNWNIPVNVIDGVPGVTCNILSSLVVDIDDLIEIEEDELAESAGDTIDEAVENSIGSFLGSSSFLKTIFALMIVINVTIWSAVASKNGFIGASCGLIALVMVTLVGMLPAWVVVIIFLLQLLLFFIFNYVQDTRGG